MSASGFTQTYVPANAVDGNNLTYWESTDNAFPQWYTVDLGSAVSIDKIVMHVPPLPVWLLRTQTLTISGGLRAGKYWQIVGSRGYTFNPATGNTASVRFPAVTVRFVDLTFTANSDWPAAQLSELMICSHL